jgi:hypothetical protein
VGAGGGAVVGGLRGVSLLLSGCERENRGGGGGLRSGGMVGMLKGGLEFKRRVEGSEVEKRAIDINVGCWMRC